MPATVSNLRDLFLVALSDILFVERMLSFEVLPDLLKRVHDPELTRGLAEHLEQTKRHVERVEQTFRAVGAEPSSAHSPPFVGLKDQHSELAENVKSERLADALHAHAAAHTEHYEIAAYRTLIALATELDIGEAMEALEGNLADEEQALEAVEKALAALTRS